MNFEIHDLLICTDGLTTNATDNEIKSATAVMAQMLDRSKGISFNLEMVISDRAKLTIEWQAFSTKTGIISWRGEARICGLYGRMVGQGGPNGLEQAFG